MAPLEPSLGTVPSINFSNVISAPQLAGLILIAGVIGIIAGLICAYHWHRYGMGIKRAFLSEIIYFGVLLALVVVGLILVSIMPR